MQEHVLRGGGIESHTLSGKGQRTNRHERNGARKRSLPHAKLQNFPLVAAHNMEFGRVQQDENSIVCVNQVPLGQGQATL
jgi:hypothetical protein